ncbi:MAG: LysM peptidoglycan-binding domain-containing protein [Chloroflexi bacterium]|nr:LysM peptidoglycan-binding domain-containing protein [Chloroflexota bacterium]
MMRQGERGWDGDPYRYRVQWGYTTDGSSDWTKVSNWQEIPWDDIYPRTAPGAMAPFSVRFAAPSSKITLFFRAWKKWGNAYEELDVNLDEISLRECGPEPPEEVCVDKTTGARLSYQEALQIAQDSECLEQGQLKETHFCNENTGTWWIDLDIVEPGCAPACVINVNDNTAEINWRCTGLLWPCWTHVVQRGDTLSGIAAAYGSTVAQIVADNGIVNPHVIYVGQELWVCDP